MLEMGGYVAFLFRREKNLRVKFFSLQNCSLACHYTSPILKQIQEYRLIKEFYQE